MRRSAVQEPSRAAIERRREAGYLRERRRGRSRKPSPLWRVRDDLPRRITWPLIGLSVALPLLIWMALYASGTVSRIFLPSPLAVADAAVDLARSGDLAADTWASVRRIAIGFGIAVAISVPLGLAMGAYRSVQSLFEPAIALVRYMPATAFVPLLLIWLGLGESPKIALIVIGTVFFNTLMTANVVWQVPMELIKVSYTLGASSFTVFRKVIFPYAIPGMIDAARVNLAAAWNLIVVAELLAASEGLGFRITRAQRFLNIDQIFVVLAVIGLLGLASDLGLRMLRNRIAPWSQE
ncbi:MAG TPA: ABC transporter permease [Dehalococcoidia bacterium]|nr:ABC transporter permease [Dehalococcoidia bacterium]